MHPERIVNITSLGLRKTMDIEVDHPDHCFIANGILTSNSHAYSYASLTLKTAIIKAKYLKEFYCAWLTYSDKKPDAQKEREELVNEAKLNNIKVLPPNIKTCNLDFEIQDKDILYGLKHIRGIGEKASVKLSDLKSKLQSWKGFLSSVPKIKRHVAEALIKSGACDSFGMSRCQMVKEIYAIYGSGAGENAVLKSLTDKELKHVTPMIDSHTTKECLQSIIDNGVCVKKRVEAIQKKLDYLCTDCQDTSLQKSIFEKIYLGIALSCSAVDDVVNDPEIQEELKKCTDCKGLITGKFDQKYRTYCVIDKVEKKKTGDKAKNPGQEYCYLKASDNTGGLSNLIVWPEQYERYKDLISEHQVVKIYCEKKKWKDREQIIVNKIEEV